MVSILYMMTCLKGTFHRWNENSFTCFGLPICTPKIRPTWYTFLDLISQLCLFLCLVQHMRTSNILTKNVLLSLLILYSFVYLNYLDRWKNIAISYIFLLSRFKAEIRYNLQKIKCKFWYTPIEFMKNVISSTNKGAEYFVYQDLGGWKESFSTISIL